jgi:hypothetical protein
MMRQTSLNRSQLISIGKAYVAFIFITYALVFHFNPFSEFVNTLVVDSLTVLAALTCTLILLNVLTFYQHGEPPRKVWFYFAIALALWTLGEVIWAIYHLTVSEVPLLSAADGFWALGYVFFTAALVNQYRLVFFDKTQKPFWIALGIWIAALLLTILVLFLVKSESPVTDFLVYFYPFGDFSIGVAALILIITFRRGSLARPWLSLFAFVISDSFYIWATSSGLYDWTGAGGSLLTLAVELVYLAAYLFMGWSLFQQYLILRFSATANRITSPR